MYLVDLEKLMKCSQSVNYCSFGKISPHTGKVLTDWITSMINQVTSPFKTLRETQIDSCKKPEWEKKLQKDLLAVWQTSILMNGDVDSFIDRVTEFVLKNKNENMIFPIINSGWKSDAWLTGLALNKGLKGKLNSNNIGFGVNGKPNGEDQVNIPIEKSSYDILYIDDASYSGTQLFNILNSVYLAGLRPKRIFIMLAGVAVKANSKIFSSIIWEKTKCEPVYDKNITKVMNIWVPDTVTQKLLRSFYGFTNHLEADPDTLKPKPTTGEFPIFSDNCLEIPPYKIPDSLSVPTHLYLAYDPEKKSSIFENEGGHIFSQSGKVNYRTVMQNGAKDFASIFNK